MKLRIIKEQKMYSVQEDIGLIFTNWRTAYSSSSIEQAHKDLEFLKEELRIYFAPKQIEVIHEEEI